MIYHTLRTDRITIFQGDSNTGKSKSLYNILAKMNTTYPVMLFAKSSVMFTEKPDPKDVNDLSLYNKLVLRILSQSQMEFVGHNITAFDTTPTQYVDILNDVLQRHSIEEKIICIDDATEIMNDSGDFLSLLLQIQQKFEVPIIVVTTSKVSCHDTNKCDYYHFEKVEDFFSMRHNSEEAFNFLIAPNCQIFSLDEVDAFLHLNMSIDEIEHYDPVATIKDGKIIYSTGKWLDRDTVENQTRFTCMHEHCRHPAQGYPVLDSVPEMIEHVLEHLMVGDN